MGYKIKLNGHDNCLGSKSKSEILNLKCHCGYSEAAGAEGPTDAQKACLP